VVVDIEPADVPDDRRIRGGGASVPSVDELALVIRRCRELAVAFKATAGLQHAARADGQHGFLNLLALL
jgi:hypothetical protein